MILVYVNDYYYSSKIFSYLQCAGLKCTTDINEDYESILIMETSKKVIDFISNKNKKIFFVSYLIEQKLYQLYKKDDPKLFNKYKKVFDICYKIIVSLPIYKLILKDLFNYDNSLVIEKELPVIHMSSAIKENFKRFKIPKKGKKILILDFDFKYIKQVNNLAYIYPKHNFIYVAYKPYYNMTKNEKKAIKRLEKNIVIVHFWDLNIFFDLCRISHVVINFIEQLDIKYLYSIILFRKTFLCIESLLYRDYLIDSKNCYLFANDIEKKLKKIFEHRLGDVTESAVDLIHNNCYQGIIEKIKKI